MQFTFPSDSLLSAMASRAQNLGSFVNEERGHRNEYAYEETKLSMRGLEMNSLSRPMRQEGWVS